MRIRFFDLLLGVVVALVAGIAHAQSAATGLLVLGVIATADADDGVALLKRQGDGRTFAARVGHEVQQGVVVFRVTREYVYVKVNGRLDKVKVGEELESTSAPSSANTASHGAPSGGVQRDGNNVRLTSAYREHLKTQLNKILMQAAAVPYYVNGQLQGFRLWDIDEGSIYDQAGFANGDLITAINGTTLSDVSQTIRMLQSLREETNAAVTYIRKGVEQTLQISIQ